MNDKIRIVSNDGISNNTKIFINDERIYNVTKIEILPIMADDSMVQVKVNFENVELDIQGECK